MKVLNLFAGIGGNRSTWQNVEVTAVEQDPFIANIYQKRFPQDEMIIGAVIGIYEKIFQEFDFIWSSPPCQSHSMFNMVWFDKGQITTPDMNNLYGIMTILQYLFKGKWVVENVRPWYHKYSKPLKLGRHYFWSNFFIPFHSFSQYNDTTVESLNIEELLVYHQIADFECESYKKRQILRNCVDFRIGQYILNCACKQTQTTLTTRGASNDR